VADKPSTGSVTVSERRRLSTQDQFWLEMDRPNNLMVVDSVMWTSTPLDWDRLRDVMNNRFAGRYPVFRSLAIRDDDGSWWWQESPDFDLDDHVTMVSLDDPDDPASLQRLIAEHRTEMLDRSTGATLVQVEAIGRDQSEFPLQYDPGHPAADENGYVRTPNVSSIIEMNNMREAARSYEANMNMYEAARTMRRQMLDLLK